MATVRIIGDAVFIGGEQVATLHETADHTTQRAFASAIESDGFATTYRRAADAWRRPPARRA